MPPYRPPVYRLDDRLFFPPPEKGPRRGPIAVGGDLRPARLVIAYSMGIFPWQGDPLHWHSPDPRMVLLTDQLHVTRSLRRLQKKQPYRLTLDTAFKAVMTECMSVPRPGQEGTWITPAMIEAYAELHARGVAHSVEAWHDDRLVGGLYGVSLGACFFGESMFALEPDASKLAFVALVEQLEHWNIPMVDCQVYTPHLAHFGAREWPREDFLEALKAALKQDTRLGPWRFDDATSEPAQPEEPAEPVEPAATPGGGAAKPAPKRSRRGSGSR